MTNEYSPVPHHVRFAFQRLDLPVHADVGQVEAAFNSLLETHHPDNGGEWENFTGIVDARQICLSYAQHPELFDEPEAMRILRDDAESRRQRHSDLREKLRVHEENQREFRKMQAQKHRARWGVPEPDEGGSTHNPTSRSISWVAYSLVFTTLIVLATTLFLLLAK